MICQYETALLRQLLSQCVLASIRAQLLSADLSHIFSSDMPTCARSNVPSSRLCHLRVHQALHTTPASTGRAELLLCCAFKDDNGGQPFSLPAWIASGGGRGIGTARDIRGWSMRSRSPRWCRSTFFCRFLFSLSRDRTVTSRGVRSLSSRC